MAADPSQWPTYAAPWNLEFKEAWAATPGGMPDMEDATVIPTVRANINSATNAALLAGLDFTGVEQTKIEIPVRDGTTLTSLLFKPTTPPAGGSPLAVLYHGGGWVIGSAEMESVPAIALVKESGAVVVSVEYRMAPEHTFPGPVHDSWDALKWCASKAAALGADPTKGFLVGGSSAGGNISAVLQHLARDEKLSPPVTGVWLGYPVTVAPQAVPEHLKSTYTSYDQNADAPVLTRKGMTLVTGFYKADPQSELFSPLLWPSGHAGLARTYVQVCGMDPLRDDGLLYEQELRREGVETKLDVYPGLPHGFDLMYAQLGATAKYQQDRAKAFQWLLRRE